jgi:thiol-disulfide isomerase/thioredoxin
MKKNKQNPIPENGTWTFSFSSQNHAIPIKAELQNDSLFFYNAEEKISFAIHYSLDSFYVDIPNFNSHLEGSIQSDTQLNGVFVKDYVEDYSIPFQASKSNIKKVDLKDKSTFSLKNKYDVSIIDGNKTRKAIGIFALNAGSISASFATETGDNRFLEGAIEDNKLSISRFDGSSLQLFTADIAGDSLINGVFISGKGGNYKWEGVYDPDVELRNPEYLTQLKEGQDYLSFQAVDLNNHPVSLENKRFENKIKIIQITGTWCPNCLDETKYFTELYKEYKDKGVEIIAIAFENGTDTLKILENLKKYKQNNHIEYTLLYGGKASTKSAEAMFPMIQKIMAFPTAIYLNRDNKVEKIYTGFYGPGTGEYYTEYTKNTELFLNKLLNSTN